jgi:hypothetical protein
MIKSFTALAIMSLLGGSVVALPVFAPSVKADEATALVKADRLPVRSVARDCSRQIWPDFGRSCLLDSGTGATVREARLVVLHR